MKRASLLFVALAAGACDVRSPAYGDTNSIIAVMSPELWEQVEDDVYEALEPTIQTVRNEKMFTVTHQDPRGEYWGRLRRFRQMLLVGTETDFWMAQALEAGGEDVPANGIVQVNDVWSRGQTTTLLRLSAPDAIDELRSYLPQVHQLLDAQFRNFARQRMFMTAVDSALADTLVAQAGFELLLPEVYRWRHSDSVYVFRNDNPDPSELIREIVVTWRTPDRVTLDRDALLAWRAEVVAAHYNEPQDVGLSHADDGPFTYDGHDGYQIQAVWNNPPELGWPAGGPFITRLISCPDQDRVYLVDAWLYAPGKEKYEYMIQLETLLDSFDCRF